ncbi:DUF1080 domain-containing protein [Fulvivirgaceae bacterium BMA10]|uniref:DUF1080 domain-containing protein n=1 Tax=Splendidivirga corallicola TaxID=3051826 RepID=A0ABT8KUI2_9BACT|nr:DUF1080 domain-containing protein [Fulvivirgaceae bacterium BMA10]
MIYPERILKSLILVCLPVVTFAQKDPKLTEEWEPVPKVITPGVGTAPPSDAIVLFNGSDLSEWQGQNGTAEWEIKDGAMVVVAGKGTIKTKRVFGDVQLHIEWRSPEVIQGEGQGRGNSGVFLQEQYEVQVLDSYENVTYSNGQAGSIYKQHIPLVNVSKKPGEWQTYDIIFTTPLFKEDGSLGRAAHMTIIHNGVLIHNHVKLNGPTVYIGKPKYKSHPEKMSISLQDHGNPVAFRNIWVREL